MGCLESLLLVQNPWWRDPSSRKARAFPVRRQAFAEMVERLSDAGNRRALVLTGPRQVGKTTLLRQVADYFLDQGWPPGNLLAFDFSDERVTGEVTAREVVEYEPEGLVLDHPRLLLLDEIRLAPGWSAWLKQAVDDGVGRILATDSASSVLREGKRDSGLGRWDELKVEGLLFREYLRLVGMPQEEPEHTLERVPNALERYLTVGGFPEHAASEDLDDALERLRSDIADKAILRDLKDLKRLDLDVDRVHDLFFYLVRDSGSIFNASKRTRDFEPRPKSLTVQGWVDRLLDTMLLARLEKRTLRATEELRKRPQPKIFAADHGLIVAFSPFPKRLDGEGIRPRVFESVVFRHLRELVRRVSGKLTFFRDNNEEEIDFVLNCDQGVFGVEVTSSSETRGRKLALLEKADRALGADRLFLIHGGFREFTEKNIRGIPLRAFLLQPDSILESTD